MAVTRTLHAAGNFRALHPLARHPAVDAIEADVWVRSGRLVAHHERPIDWLPLMVHSGGVSLRRRDPVELDELLHAVEGGCSLVLDLRSWFGDPAPEAARLLQAVENRAHVSVTCESWDVADRLRAWLPDLTVAYSVRSEQQLRRYVAGRIDGTIDAVPVAMRHSLLHHAGEVAAIRRWAGRIAVWTVDDVDRAIELAGWGVDEVVSNQLIVLNSL